MSGKGETVTYTRIVAKDATERKLLKEKIDALIDGASTTITVEAMIVVPESKKESKET